MTTEFNTIADKNLLTTGELAEFLRISKVSVYRLVEERKISFYKVRRQIRFSQSGILKYLQNNCVESVQ
jgi:excisionase family DNA binding protein